MERPVSEDPKRALAAQLAEAAARLAPRVDKKRAPDGHIYAALDQAGIRDLAERKALIPEIKRVLARRNAPVLDAWTSLMAGAKKNEASHPKEEEEDEA